MGTPRNFRDGISVGLPSYKRMDISVSNMGSAIAQSPKIAANDDFPSYQRIMHTLTNLPVFNLDPKYSAVGTTVRNHALTSLDYYSTLWEVPKNGSDCLSIAMWAAFDAYMVGIPIPLNVIPWYLQSEANWNVAEPVTSIVFRQVTVKGHTFDEELVLIDNNDNRNWWEATVIVPKADYSKPEKYDLDTIYYICAGTSDGWVFREPDHVLRVFKYPAWEKNREQFKDPVTGFLSKYELPGPVGVNINDL